jgi:hypothetical protein
MHNNENCEYVVFTGWLSAKHHINSKQRKTNRTYEKPGILTGSFGGGAYQLQSTKKKLERFEPGNREQSAKCNNVSITCNHGKTGRGHFTIHKLSDQLEFNNR